MDRSKSFIKRVVGLPGERVEIRNGRVWVNGRELYEPYMRPEFYDTASYPATLIPPNQYYVLGDHRASSNDSRVWGTVDARFIYGKAVFCYWPFDRFGALETFANGKP
jgi:signal peptidase I